MGGLSESGRLELRGRKKELVVTSYGRNISPQKVEILLKDVPGVGEALLVGEGRPFRTALLWLEDDMPEVFGFAILDEGVRSMNEGLSHPEQVKRWTVLERQPAVSSGELTPNLKLSRTRVLESRPEAVEKCKLVLDRVGNPPTLTIMALAKRAARVMRETLR